MATDADYAGQQRREGGDLPAEPASAAPGLRFVTPREDAAEGGDRVCWAHLVCEQCGAVATEGHRDWCPAATAAG